jgi:3-deoxy-manno-octulosonate cytidylyltransferase (CMP-KDO synthetase)
MMKRKIVAVVPARLGSTRFPGKVLHPWRGKPLLSHLLDELKRCRRIDRLIVATDSAEIEATLGDREVEVVRTSKRHRTGSDRVAEVMAKVRGDVYVNIQADNIGLKARGLDLILDRFLNDPGSRFGTVARRIDSDDELFDPNSVKLVMDQNQRALWFSRYPLPYLQAADDGERWRQYRYYHHIGIYLFRAAALKQYAGWHRGNLEKAESLEQLRILENGEPLKVFLTRMKALSIDRPEDLKKLDGRHK